MMNRIFTIQFLIELIVVGVLSILFGYVAGYIVGMTSDVNLPEICRTWNKYYVMEKTLFWTGIFTYLAVHITGVSKWYCSNSIACKA
jgi:ABC-type antimicrobial peptide transport system permease subunit